MVAAMPTTIAVSKRVKQASGRKTRMGVRNNHMLVSTPIEPHRNGGRIRAGKQQPERHNPGFNKMLRSVKTLKHKNSLPISIR